MPEPLPETVRELRGLLLDPGLHRAVAAGRRHGSPAPRWRRAELRPVELKSGRRLQEVRYDALSAQTRNHAYPGEAAACVDDLLALPWGSWLVRGVGGTVQVRVTKRGQAQVHREGPAPASAPSRSHDRVKDRLLSGDDPLFAELGAGADKRRQVEAFLRLLAPDLPVVGDRDPVHLVDLGCGNAYLSFAALRYLTLHHCGAVQLTGVDRKPEAATRNRELASRLGHGTTCFVVGDIATASLPAADVVLALHACDTATDEALARAVGWNTRLILAAPCCHHETARAVRETGAPGEWAAVTRHGILRERLADVLTDALRALLLRLCGYRVDVVEFVGGEHTARNVAIRAVRTEAGAGPELIEEYHELVGTWGLRPRLAVLLSEELTRRHGGTW